VVLAGGLLSTGMELTQYYIAERVSAAIAFAVWLLLADSVSARIRVTLIAVLFSGHVIFERLAPFEFTTYGRAFGWIPFHSFLYGSIELNIVSFLEKAFLYGAMIWLLDMSGLRLGISHYSRRSSAVCHQLGGNLPPRPLGGDHRCAHGAADRRNHRGGENTGRRAPVTERPERGWRLIGHVLATGRGADFGIATALL